MGRSIQRGLVMSISPTQRIPYMSRKAPMAPLASLPPASSASPVKEVLVPVDVLQKGDDLRMRPDHVGDVQEGQAHL